MDTIGKYKLVRVIGEGGMGRVYEAMDPVIGRRVAVKTISLNVVADAETRARFFREGQAAGQLSHPNLITIHDIGESENTPYIVMEYLEGMDLSHAIQKERLLVPTGRCRSWSTSARGSSSRMVTRSSTGTSSPRNLMRIGARQDHGLRARPTAPPRDPERALVGTPNYMSPEQIRGESLDGRAESVRARRRPTRC